MILIEIRGCRSKDRQLHEEKPPRPPWRTPAMKAWTFFASRGTEHGPRVAKLFWSLVTPATGRFYLYTSLP